MAGALDEPQTARARSAGTALATVRWMPYRLFPYERRLGLRELDRLGTSVLEERDDAVLVSGDPATVVARSAYFHEVQTHNQPAVPTEQSEVEAAHRLRRAGKGARQATRYGLHGIHEYKGKFNPQVVRALCNVVDTEAQFLIDPFCGSGTAPLEGLRLGMDVLGVDRSPIAWFLASAKLDAAVAGDKVALDAELRRLSRRVARALDRGQSRTGHAGPVPTLSDATVEYLEDWFTPPAFSALACALRSLHTSRASVAGRLCLVALSSVLRSISLQLPEDLRIRRRPESFEAPEIAPLFVKAAAAIRGDLAEMAGWHKTGSTATVVRGSASDRRVFAAAGGGRRRLILTSPPYATALPYIDTDRLSILALGLADASDLLSLERGLLGSREWLRAEQARWNDRRERNADALPSAVTGLLRSIHEKNAGTTAGFRRIAVPSLLYRYFAGMANAMATWLTVLEPGESAVLIVGRNRTTAGGERVEIATPELLAETAIARGFEVRELIRLETWPRYGMHSANGVPGEDALVITRPAMRASV
ncbi:MAG TPA: hypothetical protein VK756_10965 [Solirubrobacteraceae bacterium]|jgi:hypothetical protein|nr:hypothetical protein [Solirubrobacteraceae bacterium]